MRQKNQHWLIQNNQITNPSSYNYRFIILYAHLLIYLESMLRRLMAIIARIRINIVYSPLTAIQSITTYIYLFYIRFQFRKYDKNPFQIYRQLFSFIRSWKKYTQHHQQAKLFVSLLTQNRNTHHGVKQFLKFRKIILKSLDCKILQELSLTHEDTLAITHTLFAHDMEIKSYVTKKINEMFISLKRKLINSAKINGAVMCEFFMACGERFNQLNINNLFGGDASKSTKKKLIPSSFLAKHQQNSINQQNYYKNYTAQNAINKRMPLNERTDNNITYLKNPQQFENTNSYGQKHGRTNNNQNNKFDEIKYNLSFSEEYASYYSPPQQKSNQQHKTNQQYLRTPTTNQPHNQHEQQRPYNKKQSNQYVINYEELENEWKIHNSERQAPINLVRNSLTFFKLKDKQIDDKLSNLRKNGCNNQEPKDQNVNKNIDKLKQQQDPLIRTHEKNKIFKQQPRIEIYEYPEGWDNFIKTNQKTKRKLMGIKNNDEQYAERIF